LSILSLLPRESSRESQSSIKLIVESPVFLHTMSKMNRQNPKQDIPVMSKDEIASLFATRAEASRGVQLYRADGSPIVGGLFGNAEIAAWQLKSKRYRGKKVECKLLCCTQNRAPVKPHSFSEQVSYPDPYRSYEPQDDEWIKVEKRSVRRLKIRARFARDDEQFTRPNVFYAMHDD